MQPLIFVSSNCISKIKLFPTVLPVLSQVRWKKIPKRKPRWLPMAPTKVFRIPQKMYVPPDEQQLADDMMEEYYRILDSLRKSFKDEIQQNTISEEEVLLQKQKEENEFQFLLEENRKENERLRIIREEAIENDFQEELLQWLQAAEETKKEKEQIKLKVEEIVRKEKEKVESYITLENIDEVIEKAIDSPINLNFYITVDGTVTWEGKPSLEYEADIRQRISKAKESLHAVK